ncbi:DUF6233 domain-containing protein [Streptomyces laurentii]|uniref:DUF6233 domain-containing protein n=1 Tax=Streptomyces laurentii TaxID=39478 RepID=UPI0036C52992
MDTADRIEKHRAVLSWLEYQVAQTRATIERLEHEQAEQARRHAQAVRETRWKVEPSRAERGRPTLHRGDCGQYERGGGLLDRQDVQTLLGEFPGTRMCDICRPWGSLGIDKPPAQANRPDDVEFP